MESFTRSNPDFNGRVLFLEPIQNKLWDEPTKIDDDIRDFLNAKGGEVVPFENKHFGARYPYGNKIEALSALPVDVPFVFFDTDTLFLNKLSNVSFDFDVPSASLMRTNTWPKDGVSEYSRKEIWKSLYTRFGVDFSKSLDGEYPEQDWRHYSYFNAGWFYHRNAQEFYDLFSKYACSIESEPPPELSGQSLDPWLDQVALPLVINALGGGKAPALNGYLDGSVSLHYRTLPLLFAKGTDSQVEYLKTLGADAGVKKMISRYEPFDQLLYHGKGQEARNLTQRMDMADEGSIRRALRGANLWYR